MSHLNFCAFAYVAGNRSDRFVVAAHLLPLKFHVSHLALHLISFLLEAIASEGMSQESRHTTSYAESWFIGTHQSVTTLPFVSLLLDTYIGQSIGKMPSLLSFSDTVSTNAMILSISVFGALDPTNAVVVVRWLESTTFGSVARLVFTYS